MPRVSHLGATLIVLPLLAIGSAAPRARAQEPLPPPAAVIADGSGFGTRRPVVVAVEHLGGAMVTRTKTEGSEANSTLTAGTFLGPLLGQLPVARLGIHYFVAPPISIGGLLTYSDNDFYGETLLLGARLGAAFPLGSSADLWIRGGIVYIRSEASLLGTTTISDLRPGGEALIALSPLENFGVLLGGMFELGVAGKIEGEILGQKTERDFDYMEYGFTAGVFTNF